MISRSILTLGIVVVLVSVLAGPAAAICTATIGDFVWLDLDRDGIQDSNEPGVEGVTVTLHRVLNGYDWVRTTDAQGYYHLPSVACGEYYLVFDCPTGYEFTQQDAGSDDTVDSDADPLTGRTQNVMLTNGTADMTWDAGIYLPEEEPGIELEKTADASVVPQGGQVTYTYRVKNIGTVTLYNVTIIDDNGTPGATADDFVVATIPVLNPGEEKTYTFTVTLTLPMCADIDGQPTNVGFLSTQVLANGDVKITYIQSRNVVDNTYGANATGYHEHRLATFKDRVNSDNAEFSLTNGAGDEVLAFEVDYITASSSYPSGYGTLGVTGGDGSMITGDAADVVSCSTSLTTNLNQSPAFYGYTTDSPPEPNPSWDYFNSYTVVVSGAAFGASGFGTVTVPAVHNSPPCRYEPEPCEGCVTNIATVAAVTDSGEELTASDWAEVCIGDATPTDPGVSLTKTASPTTVPSGGEVTYTYTVKNTGATTLYDVTVMDDNGTPEDAGDDFLVVTIASMAPGEQATFSLTLTLTNTSSSRKKRVTNIATVTAVTDSGQEVTDSDEATVDVKKGKKDGPPSSALSLTKTASPVTVVTYTYTVENTGQSPLADIIVTDDNGTPKTADDDFLVGTIPSLAPGEQATLSVTLTVTSSSRSKSVTNTATATGTNTDTGQEVTATAKATVTVSVSK